MWCADFGEIWLLMGIIIIIIILKKDKLTSAEQNLNISVRHLSKQPEMLTGVSSYSMWAKRHFMRLLLYESQLILIEHNIKWWPFVLIGSPSLSSITVRPEPIPANEKPHHWTYWGRSQLILEVEKCGPLRRTCVSEVVLRYFTPEKIATLLCLHNHVVSLRF